MILFDEKELEYIKEKFTGILINDGKFEDDKDYQSYIDLIGQDSIDNSKIVIQNFENINIDEKINALCVECIFWIEGMWVWHCEWRHLHYDIEEMKEYFENDTIFLSLYDKICCQEDHIDDEE